IGDYLCHQDQWQSHFIHGFGADYGKSIISFCDMLSLNCTFTDLL
ncbi:hypothetical protein WG66_004024, partial [Moniliophthora roreri]